MSTSIANSILVDRDGAFEVIAATALELSRKIPDEGLPMARKTAEAILEFGDDLRLAACAVEAHQLEAA